MKSPTDNPADPLGSLGAPTRPAVPAPAPPAARHFELGNWASTLPEGLAEKPAEPPAVDADLSVTDWGGPTVRAEA